MEEPVTDCIMAKARTMLHTSVWFDEDMEWKEHEFLSSGRVIDEVRRQIPLAYAAAGEFIEEASYDMISLSKAEFMHMM